MWWTGPNPEDCLEVHINPNEITIWQHLNGGITGATMDGKTGLELAQFMLTHLDRRN